MITTSANRVKAGGYWCFDGDDQANKLVAALKEHGVDVGLDDEIDMRDTLRYIGVSSTLLALGEPRRCYKVRADWVLNRYTQRLFNYLRRALELRLGRDVPLAKEMIRCSGAEHTEHRKKLLEKWLKIKYGTEEPGMLAICNAMVILLSEYPDNIKAVHATKAILSIPEYTSRYEEVRQLLMDELNAA